jgi:hypothetical protein
MSENWEFALSHVTGDFVMYLGDDDGLLPNACNDIASIINNSGTRALIWNKATYNWPSLKQSPNFISLQCTFNLCEMRGEIMLRGIASGKTSYGRLPVLYSGFVSMDVVNSVKRKTGNFFQSITPDVYSGIVLAGELPTYLYSFRPFSINGASSHSNGIATFTNDIKAQRFFKENDLQINCQVPIIMGSIQSHVAESFLQAQQFGLLKKFRLHFNRIHNNIFQELLLLEPILRQNGLQTLSSLHLNKKNRQLVESELIKFEENKFQQIRAETKQLFNNSININGNVSFNAIQIGIENSYDACRFLGIILGKYSIPSQIIKANYLAYFIVVCKRYFSKVFAKFQLPL